MSELKGKYEYEKTGQGVDLIPLRRGHWDYFVNSMESYYRCSRCGIKCLVPYGWCPCCGAYMGTDKPHPHTYGDGDRWDMTDERATLERVRKVVNKYYPARYDNQYKCGYTEIEKIIKGDEDGEKDHD